MFQPFSEFKCSQIIIIADVNLAPQLFAILLELLQLICNFLHFLKLLIVCLQ